MSVSASILPSIDYFNLHSLYRRQPVYYFIYEQPYNILSTGGKKVQWNVIKIKSKAKYSSSLDRKQTSSMVIINTGLSIIALDHLRHGPPICKKKVRLLVLTRMINELVCFSTLLFRSRWLPLLFRARSKIFLVKF